MNRCILQLWEESERGWGVRPDGCSIHLDEDHRKNFIDGVYKLRDKTNIVPDEYDRPVGISLICFISDQLFEQVSKVGSVRIYQHEINNLIDAEDLIIKS
jgi:hypothetical protein